MNLITPFFRPLLFIVVAVVATAIGYRLINFAGVVPLTTEENCDLAQRNCIAGHGKVRIVVSLSPHPIPVLDEVGVSVRTVGVKADSLHIRVTGIEENMGISETNLLPGSDGIYRGTFHLSICSRRIMSWKTVISWKNNIDAHQAVFRFQTQGERPFMILE